MFQPFRRLGGWLALAIAVALAWPQGSAAQPSFSAEANAAAAGVQDSSSGSGATPQAVAAGPVSANGVTASAAASADFCRLTGSSSVTASAAPGMGGFSGGASTRASFAFDDLVFSGPSSPVTVNGMNVFFVGSLTAAVSPPQNVIQFARVDSGILVGGFSLISFARLDYVGSTGTASINDGGLLVGAGTLSSFPGGATYSFNGILTTGSFSVPVGLPLDFSVNLDLQGNATLTSASGGSGEASTDFGLPGGLSIALGGPIFDLPDGYSVNSTQARIVDNVCYTPASVPALPLAGALVLGVGLAALGLRALRCSAR